MLLSSFTLFLFSLSAGLVAGQGYNFTCVLDLDPSPESPKSVHELRPADISVVGAVGDSITAGFMAGADNILQLFEYRGLAWSIGGETDLTDLITVPNILKNFNNPDLYGYSTGNGGASSASAVFNQAISGAVSSDMPGQAETLISTMKADSNIDFENDWKVVTLWIGGNDLCAVCNDPNRYTPENYVTNIRRALQILRDGMPRTLVNLVGILNVAQLWQVTGTGCNLNLCSCATEENVEYIGDMADQYNGEIRELSFSAEWDTPSDDFTVVYQPFFEEVTVPLTPDGQPDRSYFAPDCFHFSLLGHSASATGLWNNMLQPVGDKENAWTPGEALLCPTLRNPYIFTARNSAKARYENGNSTFAPKVIQTQR